MVLLMSMSRHSSPMVSKDFTEVSSSLPLVSSSTVACTSAYIYIIKCWFNFVKKDHQVIIYNKVNYRKGLDPFN